MYVRGGTEGTTIIPGSATSTAGQQLLLAAPLCPRSPQVDLVVNRTVCIRCCRAPNASRDTECDFLEHLTLSDNKPRGSPPLLLCECLLAVGGVRALLVLFFSPRQINGALNRAALNVFLRFTGRPRVYEPSSTTVLLSLTLSAAHKRARGRRQ